MAERNRGLVGAIVGTVFATVAFLGPVAFLIGVQSRSDTLDGVTDGPVPIVTEAGLRSVDTRAAATLELSWTVGPTLKSPGLDGRVTRIAVEAGDTIISGDVILAVDGIDRIALVTPEPMVRTLDRGAKGPDVEWLQDYLTEAGFFSENITGTYGYRTDRAVKAWRTSLGDPDPSGVFLPQLVLWLPGEPFAVDAVLVAVDDVAPGVGSPVVTSPSSLSTAVVGVREGQTVPVSGDLVFASSEGDAIALSGELVVVDLGSVAALLAVSAEVESVDGFVRATSSTEVATVPTSAVIADGTGGVCVWKSDGDGFAAVPVELARATAGVAFVGTGVQPGDKVLVNPVEILDVWACR